MIFVVNFYFDLFGHKGEKEIESISLKNLNNKILLLRYYLLLLLRYKLLLQ